MERNNHNIIQKESLLFYDKENTTDVGTFLSKKGAIKWKNHIVTTNLLLCEMESKHDENEDWYERNTASENISKCIMTHEETIKKDVNKELENNNKKQHNIPFLINPSLPIIKCFVTPRFGYILFYEIKNTNINLIQLLFISS